ncbi:MAG: hypothetical protein ACK4YV_05070 [Emticicia sp.]
MFFKSFKSAEKTNVNDVQKINYENISYGQCQYSKIGYSIENQNNIGLSE